MVSSLITWLAIIAAIESWLDGAVAPSVQSRAVIRFAGRDTAANVTGIDPRREVRVSKLATQIVEGRLEALYTASNAIILGDRLAATIDARRGGDPAASHTAKMLAKGAAKCAEKFGEEAIEAIIEAAKIDAGGGDKGALTREAADVLYHLLVMLAASDVTLDQVLTELERREGASGIAEKAARRQD